MKRYSEERKEAVLRKMLPPINTPIAELAQDEGISAITLYKWRKQLREQGNAVPGNGNNAEKWSTEDKFAVVLETAALNEAEMAEYCRKKGLFVEQVAAWKQACMQANANETTLTKTERKQNQKDAKKVKALERELRYKEKALAETAALLVLRKKANAIWGEDEDE